MTLIHAILLGLLQGATEFLPVSSSGHLAIAQYFIHGFEQPGVLFDVVLHCGTLCAVMIYFWKDVKSLITAPWASGDEGIERRRLLWLIVAGSVPTALIGLTFKDALTAVFHNIPLVCAMLLVTGTVLFVAERWRKGERRLDQLTLADTLITGVVQGCAILPGISRSGSTIAALLFRGVDGAAAARFSFLLSMPAVGGAALLSLKDVDQLADGQLALYLAGGAMAFVSGLLSIHLLMAVLRKRRLAAFAVYCWGAGALFFMLS
nr:undecaprenyl-diphosphate phosphatase [uncultured Desulfuromonas sp.]